MCAEAHADTQHYLSYRFQNQGSIAAGAHRLMFSLVPHLQVSSPPGWRRPLQLCLTLSRVLKAVTLSLCVYCKHQKGSFCLKLFWVDGGVVVPLVKCLSYCSLFLSPSSLSVSLTFYTAFARKMCCVRYAQVHAHRSFTLPAWHCSVTVHCMMKGCITRLLKHSKSSTFYETHRGKKRGVAFHAHLLSYIIF